MYVVFVILLKLNELVITHIMLYVLPVIWLVAVVMSIISYIKYKNVLSLFLCLVGIFLFCFYIMALAFFNWSSMESLLVEENINKSAEMMLGCQG